MNYLYVTRGAPGCGKSTFLKECGVDLTGYILSPDDIRLMMRSPIDTVEGEQCIDQSQNKQVFELFYTMLKNRMRNGDFTVVDATCSSRKEINTYRTLARQYNYELYIIDFTDVPIETCIDRNKGRYPIFKRVPEFVIHKMYERFKTDTVPGNVNVCSPAEFMGFLYIKLGHLYWDDAIDLSSYKKINCIGDIHGCFNVYSDIVPEIKDNEAYIFVGDYFDRGPDIVKMFSYLQDIMNKPNVFLFMGNHEQHIVDWLREDTLPDKLYETKRTIQEILSNGYNKKDIRRFIKKLHIMEYFKLNEKDTLLVTHAGVSGWPSILTSSHDCICGAGKYDDIYNIAENWLKNISGWNVYQVFGHRNPKRLPIDHTPRSFNLCGYPEIGHDICMISFDKNEDGKWKVCEKIVQQNTYPLCESSIHDAYKDDPERFAMQMKDENYFSLYNKSPLIRVGKSDDAYSHIVSFNFTTGAFFDKQWDVVTTHARGLFANKNTKKVAARSYDKFFLLNEHPTSTLEYILEHYDKNLYVSLKYDGFLGILSYDEVTDDLLFTSKSMVAGWKNGQYAEHFKDMLTPYIRDRQQLKEYLRDNRVSMIWEVVSSKWDPHPIQYKRPFLVLLNIVRNSYVFECVDKFDFNTLDDTLKKYFYAEKFDKNIFVKQVVAKFKKQNLPKMIPYLKKGCVSIDTKEAPYKNHEGYVIYDASGHMFKLKTYTFEIRKLCRRLFVRCQQDYLKTGKIDATSYYNICSRIAEYDKELMTIAFSEITQWLSWIEKYQHSLFKKSNKLLEQELYVDFYEAYKMYLEYRGQSMYAKIY